MGSLDSTFVQADIETLIEAMDEWESLANREFAIAQMVKSIPLPPTEDPSYELIYALKEQFRLREKEINASKAMKQETATLLKAKLFLAKRDAAVNQLFDFAQSMGVKGGSEVEELTRRLKLAEQYMQEVGIFPRYQKFLEEQKTL